VTRLAERMTNVEMRLDDLDAKLDEIKGAIQAISATNHATPTALKVKGGHNGMLTLTSDSSRTPARIAQD
jgi:hypothetical protein